MCNYGEAKNYPLFGFFGIEPSPDKAAHLFIFTPGDGKKWDIKTQRILKAAGASNLEPYSTDLCIPALKMLPECHCLQTQVFSLQLTPATKQGGGRTSWQPPEPSGSHIGKPHLRSLPRFSWPPAFHWVHLTAACPCHETVDHYLGGSLMWRRSAPVSLHWVIATMRGGVFGRRSRFDGQRVIPTIVQHTN